MKVLVIVFVVLIVGIILPVVATVMKVAVGQVVAEQKV